MTQQISKCSLCGERVKIITHSVNEFGRLAPKSTRLGMVGWERWATRNCARDGILSILPDGICTNQNPSKKITHFLKDFEKISESPNSSQKTRPILTNKKKIYCFGQPPSKNKRKRKKRKIQGHSKRTKKSVKHEWRWYQL